jgi:hypothetical protein
MLSQIKEGQSEFGRITSILIEDAGNTGSA